MLFEIVNEWYKSFTGSSRVFEDIQLEWIKKISPLLPLSLTWSLYVITLQMSHVRSNKIGDVPLVGPGITSAQGPLTSITSFEQRSRSIENSAMTSLLQGSLGGSVPGGRQHALLSPIPSAEQSSLCMSASALFLYEKHQPSSASHGAIGGYGSHGTPRRTPSRPLVSGLANIQESRLETTPLLLPQTQSQRSGASTSSYASGYR